MELLVTSPPLTLCFRLTTAILTQYFPTEKKGGGSGSDGCGLVWCSAAWCSVVCYGVVDSGRVVSCGVEWESSVVQCVPFGVVCSVVWWPSDVVQCSVMLHPAFKLRR